MTTRWFCVEDLGMKSGWVSTDGRTGGRADGRAQACLL
jgi:hypothetical protein